MKDLILVINAGSSSLKYQLFCKKGIGDFVLLCRGLYENIGNVAISNFKESFPQLVQNPVALVDHSVATEHLLTRLKQQQHITKLGDLSGVGHRVVNVGPQFLQSCFVTPDTLKEMKANIDFAPLHNPAALATLGAILKKSPQVPNVCVFDVSFHHTMPRENYLYPVPYEWFTKYQIRRYGAHGINYAFVTQRLTKIFNIPRDQLNTIICHLGNGASLCAVRAGQSLETSMGMTPLEGLMMGTRSGDLDPGIGEYYCHKTQQRFDQYIRDLNFNSGLKAVSGINNDIRQVYQAAQKNNDRALLAIKMFVKRVCKYIAIYQNELACPLTALVFTGGIGENAHYIRKLVAERMYTLLISLDPKKNQQGIKKDDFAFIHDRNSTIPVVIVQANEELMICQEVDRLIQKKIHE